MESKEAVMTRSALARRGSFATALIIGLVLVASLQARPAEATGGRTGLDVCDGSGTINAAELPAHVSSRVCDLVGREVTLGSVRLEVPPPGRGISAASIGMGYETELTIITESNGDVLIDDGSGEGEALATATTEPCDPLATPGCLAPCDADSFTINGANARVKQKQPWLFKASSRPSGFTTKQVLTHLKAGTQNIVNTRNDCALTDVVGPTAPYKGKTAKGSGISVVNGMEHCPGSNGKNIVDFGALGRFTLGLACTRYVSFDYGATWFIYEADIRLKKSAPWALNPDRASCSNEYDLQGVMTHERGHAFGLGHAEDLDAYSNLTMFPAAYPCTSYARTLGKGDRSGLAFLY